MRLPQPVPVHLLEEVTPIMQTMDPHVPVHPQGSWIPRERLQPWRCFTQYLNLGQALALLVKCDVALVEAAMQSTVAKTRSSLSFPMFVVHRVVAASP